ncbi:hypothetical protein GCM10009839_51200 [Catenulispora yoronensis]|uniref:Glycosyltransferase 2-like domain-containing protein n=1 Tax=Catenulispora yoronensis TaxID=450799 RepID=A0ABN2UR74_9ACTN
MIAHSVSSVLSSEPLSADPPPAGEAVTVLVPLLNDERRVLRCVRALLAQTRVPKLDVVFLDAGSTDLTRRLVLRAALDDPRLRLLVGAPAPVGWCAHAHACEQLAVAARGRTMVFVDPGLALAPGAIASAVAALRGPHQLDLVVAEAHRRTRPAQPPVGPSRSTSARLLAVDTEMYWRVGGHCNAAHDAQGESGLVRAVRRAGGRVASVDGRHAIEFLDGSLWPRERAGTPAPAGLGSRYAVSDTENSILHSFTDTARRLLAAFTATATPVPGRATHQARRAPVRTGTGYGSGAKPAGPIADAAANRAAGAAAQAQAAARESGEVQMVGSRLFR